MPNWTENTLTLRGQPEVLQRVLDECCSEEHNGSLDFRKIIPFPDGFDPDLPAGSGDEAYDLYFGNTHGAFLNLSSYSWVREAGVTDLDGLRVLMAKRYEESTLNAETRQKYPTYQSLADAYKRNVDVSGCKTWYDWCSNHWGTKWNACEGNVDGTPADGEITMQFNTAWAEPLPVFEALREKYPMLDIEYVTRHEGDDEITGRRWFAEDNEDEEEDN